MEKDENLTALKALTPRNLCRISRHFLHAQYVRAGRAIVKPLIMGLEYPLHSIIDNI